MSMTQLLFSFQGRLNRETLLDDGDRHDGDHYRSALACFDPDSRAQVRVRWIDTDAPRHSLHPADLDRSRHRRQAAPRPRLPLPTLASREERDASLAGSDQETEPRTASASTYGGRGNAGRACRRNEDKVTYHRRHPRHSGFRGLALLQRGRGRQFSPSRAASSCRIQAP